MMGADGSVIECKSMFGSYLLCAHCNNAASTCAVYIPSLSAAVFEPLDFVIYRCVLPCK